MKKDDLVYVEPGRGWAYVAKEPDEDGNMRVFFWNQPTWSAEEDAHEDDVFPLTEEAFLRNVKSINDQLMFYAGNYDCPNGAEANEIVQELNTLLTLAIKAKARGQFNRY